MGYTSGKRSRNIAEIMTYLEIWGAPECSGKGTSSLRMLAKVALRFLPLNGVVPKSIS